LLGAAVSDPKAGHDLVDDQENPLGIAESTQSLKEARARYNAAHVAGDRLKDNAGNLLGVGCDDLLDLLEVVIGCGQGVFGEIGRDAR